MECLGFKFTDLDFKFNKGYVELLVSHKKVSTPSDPERCRGFLDALRNGPKDAIESAKKQMGDKTPLEFLTQARDQV